MNRGKADEDEYWNSSKFKAFTFDDDDDDFTKVTFFHDDAFRSVTLCNPNSANVNDCKMTQTT